MILKRQVETGTEIFETLMPAVVTVTNDDKNLLRIAKVRDVMKAHRKPIRTLAGQEIDLSSDPATDASAYRRPRSRGCSSRHT